MKAGAVEVLTKPVPEPQLLEAISQALERDRVRRLRRCRLQDVRTRYQSLTPRERAVMRFIVGGQLNKQTADALGITETTVKVHRRNLMHKMRARALPALVLMAVQLWPDRQL
jgi:FixJ family two-component response regulator